MSKLTKDVIKQLIAENLNEGTFVTPSGKKVKKTDSGYENVEGKTSAEERKRYERLAQLKKLKAEEEPVKENKVTKSYLLKVIKEEYEAMMGGDKDIDPKKVEQAVTKNFPKAEIKSVDHFKSMPEYTSATINVPKHESFTVKFVVDGNLLAGRVLKYEDGNVVLDSTSVGAIKA